MNIILFGGSFDPIHNGHIHIAKEASKKYNAKVIFVPNSHSVWKDISIDPKDKLEMVELAIKDEPSFSVSTYELDKKQDNYTIETVHYFIDKYKEDKLFWLIGTDQVNSFDKWRKADEIASLVTILYYDRPGYKANLEMVERFKMEHIEGMLMDVSSTDIRYLRRADAPMSVLEYIEKKNLYFMKEINSLINEKRVKHTVSVAHLAVELAFRNNYSVEKAYIAAMMHDIGKNSLTENNIKFVEENYKEFMPLPKAVYHQFLSPKIATENFGITDPEILEGIRYHATGKKDMSILGKIIYAADKLDPLRGYDSSDMILACKVDINSGFIFVLKENLNYFKNNEIPFSDDLTKECMEFYLGSF